MTEPAPPNRRTTDANADPCDTVTWWDDYFRTEWVRKGGNRQTRIFAERFCRATVLRPRGGFDLHDVSCAHGESLVVFRRFWPLAQLRGSDFSPVAIDRARELHGDVAEFTVAGMEELDGYRDVIYCSNTLEHFTDYQDWARHLIRHCAHLSILVPYNETKDGKPLEPDPASQHQASFSWGSFDYLVEESLASRIRTRRLYCRGAWSWRLRSQVKATVQNVGNLILRRPLRICPTTLLFDVCSAVADHSCADRRLHKSAPPRR